MLEPFARIQEERTAQLTMATKFRHKLLQRLHGVVAGWNCINLGVWGDFRRIYAMVVVPSLCPTWLALENHISQAILSTKIRDEELLSWRVVIKTRHHLWLYFAMVYQQSLHFGRPGWVSSWCTSTTGNGDVSARSSLQVSKLCAIICINPEAKWWHEFTISRY